MNLQGRGKKTAATLQNVADWGMQAVLARTATRLVRPAPATKRHGLAGALGTRPRPCLVHPKSKKFSRFSVTSNLAAHT